MPAFATRSEVAKSSEHRQRFLNGSRESAVGALYRMCSAVRRIRKAYGRIAKESPPAGSMPSSKHAVVGGVSAEHRRNGVPGNPRGTQFNHRKAHAAAPGTMRYQAMDVNRDGVIARREWTGTRESFNEQDWNRDGVLSGEEVRGGARRRSESAVNRAGDPDGDLFQWTAADFSEIDFNRDGRIASSEWNYNADTFRRVDRNSDGVLTRQEFLAGNTGNDRFTALDANRNGRIERSEWDGTRAACDRSTRTGTTSQPGPKSWYPEPSAPPASGTNAFASIDVNRDGLNHDRRMERNRRSFERQDTNGDGAIIPREFTGAPALRSAADGRDI